MKQSLSMSITLNEIVKFWLSSSPMSKRVEFSTMDLTFWSKAMCATLTKTNMARMFWMITKFCSPSLQQNTRTFMTSKHFSAASNLQKCARAQLLHSCSQCNLRWQNTLVQASSSPVSSGLSFVESALFPRRCQPRRWIENWLCSLCQGHGALWKKSEKYRDNNLLESYDHGRNTANRQAHCRNQEKKWGHSCWTSWKYDNLITAVCFVKHIATNRTNNCTISMSICI